MSEWGILGSGSGYIPLRDGHVGGHGRGGSQKKRGAEFRVRPGLIVFYFLGGRCYIRCSTEPTLGGQSLEKEGGRFVFMLATPSPISYDTHGS
jgi:hypothetical protein